MAFWTRLSAFWKAFVGGVVGTILALAIGLVSLHLYRDHQALHAIITMIENSQRAASAPPKSP